nr:PHD finger protein ALFIN-LIKE 2-like [Ipomoea batatas]
MFRLINDQPTVHEVVTGKRSSKDKPPSADSGPKSKPSTKRLLKEKEIREIIQLFSYVMVI